MQYLGVDEAIAQEQIAEKNDSMQGTQFAKLDGNRLIVYGAAERNVNRIGSALDRIGLTVQQFVSERGMFVVRPAPSESEALEQAADKNKKTGMFSRLFSKGKKTAQAETMQAAQMFVALEELGNGQRIILLDQMGKPYTGENAQKWLNDLYRELR